MLRIFIAKLDKTYGIKFKIDNQTFSLFPVKTKIEARFYKKQLTVALTRLQNYYLSKYTYDNYSILDRIKLAIKIILNK